MIEKELTKAAAVIGVGCADYSSYERYCPLWLPES